MRDSVPSASYSSVCNVLRQWNISLIPTYRVYRLYDYVLRMGLGEKIESHSNMNGDVILRVATGRVYRNLSEGPAGPAPDKHHEIPLFAEYSQYVFLCTFCH